MIRDDISDKLIHLTRGDTDQIAADTFRLILEQRTLRGSSGCIKGGYTCVCFSEAPISQLSRILARPSPHGMRYKPFGIMVNKDWLFTRGGRPVIYQLDSEFALLTESQRYRHVRYEPGSVDFTWEREWRIWTHGLPLESDQTTVVVPTRKWEEWFQGQHTAMLSRRAMLTGFIGPKSVSKQPWHFVVLEDLGVPIDSVAPPE